MPVRGTVSKDTTKARRTIRRNKQELSDEENYKVLKLYGEGVPTSEIAKSVSRDVSTVKKIINKHLDAMNSVRETNIMAQGCTEYQMKARGTNPTKFLTQSFLDKLEDGAEIYAYYFVQTGDNKFSLENAGLDVGISRNVPKNTKEYIYRIRGQFIRNIPSIASYIKQEQDALMERLDVQKPHVQRELLNQIEELKILSVDDPRQRTNLLKAIEMLGKTVTAFTDSVRMEEANAKTGLEILMERVKKEATGREATEEIIYEPAEDEEATGQD